MNWELSTRTIRSRDDGMLLGGGSPSTADGRCGLSNVQTFHFADEADITWNPARGARSSVPAAADDEIGLRER
jgi:hypothetical protein